MIKMSEILRNAKLEDQSKEIQDNLAILLERVNKVRAAYGKPMIVTSGLRTMEDHLRIYREKGITDQSKIPMRSRHLFGQAVDISDPNGALYKWSQDNEPMLLSIGLWLERGTKGWVHFQIVPYGSYKPGNSIFFNP